MVKKYISPEINIIKFEAEDIIQTSGIIINSMPKSLDGAEQLQTQDVSIFE